MADREMGPYIWTMATKKQHHPDVLAAAAEDKSKAWAEYQAESAGVSDKIARLRAARLEREAEAAAAPKAPPPLKVRKPAASSNASPAKSTSSKSRSSKSKH
jgi:hypothetical protein